MSNGFTTPASLRRPNRRYEMARQSVASGRLLLPSRADDWTRMLARFLRREQQCETPGQRQRLVERFPEFAAALNLHREPSRETAFRLEVAILGQETDEAIAESLQISIAVIDHYTASFFAIPDLLDAEYVVEHAIKPELKRSSNDRARLRFGSKLLAYFCGIEALQQFVPSGKLSRSEPWCHPVQLVRKLASSADFLHLADLAEVSSLTFARDPERFASWLEQLIERIKKRITKPLPKDHWQRRDWKRDGHI